MMEYGRQLQEYNHSSTDSQLAGSKNQMQKQTDLTYTNIM